MGGMTENPLAQGGQTSLYLIDTSAINYFVGQPFRDALNKDFGVSSVER